MNIPLQPLPMKSRCAILGCKVLTRISHQGGEMITQEFGFTEDFAKEWNKSLYSRLNKILCEFKG